MRPPRTLSTIRDSFVYQVGVWRPWVRDLFGLAVDSGHHMAEDAPDQLADALLTFLVARAPEA